MKIAVASEGKTIDSEISPVSGRAPFYLIFEDKKLVKTIKNPFRVGGGGAGLGVASMLQDEGVKLVISGHFGEKMRPALTKNGIEFKEMSGVTVLEALA